MSTPSVICRLFPLSLVYKPPTKQVRQNARPEGCRDALSFRGLHLASEHPGEGYGVYIGHKP